MILSSTQSLWLPRQQRPTSRFGPWWRSPWRAALDKFQLKYGTGGHLTYKSSGGHLVYCPPNPCTNCQTGTVPGSVLMTGIGLTLCTGSRPTGRAPSFTVDGGNPNQTFTLNQYFSGVDYCNWIYYEIPGVSIQGHDSEGSGGSRRDYSMYINLIAKNNGFGTRWQYQMNWLMTTSITPPTFPAGDAADVNGGALTAEQSSVLDCSQSFSMTNAIIPSCSTSPFLLGSGGSFAFTPQ